MLHGMEQLAESSQTITQGVYAIELDKAFRFSGFLWFSGFCGAGQWFGGFARPDFFPGTTGDQAPGLPPVFGLRPRFFGRRVCGSVSRGFPRRVRVFVFPPEKERGHLRKEVGSNKGGLGGCFFWRVGVLLKVVSR